MSKKLRTEAVDHLFDAILCLKNKEECYTFFEDVCTVNELLSLSQRFEVAGMLEIRERIWILLEDGRFDCDDQSCEPFSELRKRWLRYGI